MTCEVMLMNMQGVALAADSAVTITTFDDRGHVAGVLAQSQVEKIFLIDEAGPVAAMIYGDARFGDYPWKTVLHALQQAIGGRRLGAEETAVRLVALLGAADDAGAFPLKVTEDAERTALRAYVDGLVLCCRDLVDSLAGGGQPVKALDAAVAEALELLAQDIRYESYVGADGLRPKRPKIGEPGQRLHGFLLQHLDRAVGEAIEAAFPRALATRELKERLRELAAESVLLHWLPPEPFGTGLVVAGYGADDLTPRYAHLRVTGAFGGVLQHVWQDWGGPTAGAEPVVFQSFAQDELIRAFALGAQQGFTAIAGAALARAVDQVFDDVEREFGRSPGARQTLAAMRAAARHEVPAKGLGVAERLFAGFTTRTLGAILDSASPDGLAEHAGKLVQLAVLDHELTGRRSVAKPISVLRMSRGAHRLDR